MAHGENVDLIESVVNHVVSSDYKNLDQKTIAAVKTVLLDSMGVAVAGSSAAGILDLVNLVRDWGGKPEARVLVYGDSVPAIHAALANCTMARAWDLDDDHEGGGGHLCGSLIPTAMVLAQYAPTKISGRELILAVAIAADLICRLRMSFTARAGWTTETFAPFGVVAIASRFLGFDKQQTRDAMGLAYTQCACNSQGTVDGALSVRLQQGLAAQAGVLATQFAQIGFTGPKNVLQGVYGLYPLYGRDAYDASMITRDLGSHFHVVNTSLKPYPCCKHTHNAISGTVKLVANHGISPASIEKIVVRTNQAAYDKCASGAAKFSPAGVVDAQFSIPVMVALGAIHGGVCLSDLISEQWKDRQVLELARKVEVRVDPELNLTSGMIRPNIIELSAAGRDYVERSEFVKGSPDDRMTPAECAEKFRQCIAVSAKPLGQRKVNEFMQMVNGLEHVEDAGSMTNLLMAE